MACGHASTGLLRLATVMLLRGRLHDAIEARFGCHIHASVGQRRHDLARRQIGKFLAVDDGQNRGTLVITELVGWLGSGTGRTTVGSDSMVSLSHPTLERTQGNAKLAAGR